MRDLSLRFHHLSGDVPSGSSASGSSANTSAIADPARNAPGMTIRCKRCEVNIILRDGMARCFKCFAEFQIVVQTAEESTTSSSSSSPGTTSSSAMAFVICPRCFRMIFFNPELGNITLCYFCKSLVETIPSLPAPVPPSSLPAPVPPSSLPAPAGKMNSAPPAGSRKKKNRFFTPPDQTTCFSEVVKFVRDMELNIPTVIDTNVWIALLQKPPPAGLLHPLEVLGTGNRWLIIIPAIRKETLGLSNKAGFPAVEMEKLYQSAITGSQLAHHFQSQALGQASVPAKYNVEGVELQICRIILTADEVNRVKNKILDLESNPMFGSFLKELKKDLEIVCQAGVISSRSEFKKKGFLFLSNDQRCSNIVTVALTGLEEAFKASTTSKKPARFFGWLSCFSIGLDLVNLFEDDEEQNTSVSSVAPGSGGVSSGTSGSSGGFSASGDSNGSSPGAPASGGGASGGAGGAPTGTRGSGGGAPAGAPGGVRGSAGTRTRGSGGGAPGGRRVSGGGEAGGAGICRKMKGLLSCCDKNAVDISERCGHELLRELSTEDELLLRIKPKRGGNRSYVKEKSLKESLENAQGDNVSSSSDRSMRCMKTREVLRAVDVNVVKPWKP